MASETMTVAEAVAWADLPYHERHNRAEMYGGPRLADQSDYIADNNERAYSALMAHARAALAPQGVTVTEAMVEVACAAFSREWYEDVEARPMRVALTAALRAAGVADAEG